MKKLIIGILAHVDAGKTTLAESLLYTCGTIRKAGRVDHGDAFLDNGDMERKRGITIFSKQARIRWKDVDITLLDTPGHVDFSAEMERTLQVLDAAILVIDGSDGDRASAIDIRLIHMHNDGLCQPSIGGRDRHLNEGIETLGDVGDSDLPGGIGLLGRDDLPISQDIEDGAFQRLLGIIQFKKFKFDFGIILKHQIHVSFPIPMEGLTDFIRVAALGVAVGRSDLVAT